MKCHFSWHQPAVLGNGRECHTLCSLQYCTVWYTMLTVKAFCVEIIMMQDTNQRVLYSLLPALPTA